MGEFFTGSLPLQFDVSLTLQVHTVSDYDDLRQKMRGSFCGFPKITSRLSKRMDEMHVHIKCYLVALNLSFYFVTCYI